MKTTVETRQNEIRIENAVTIDAELFSRFTSWIDRSEKTTHAYMMNLKQFAAWMKFAGISRPTRGDIVNYRNWLASEHDAIMIDNGSPEGWSFRRDKGGNTIRMTCKPKTVTMYLQNVKQFFEWTASEGLYPNVAANIHAPTIGRAHKKDYLRTSEVMAIENSIAETTETKVRAAAGAEKDSDGRVQRADEQGRRLKAMYLLAVTAGLRTVELSRANVGDLEYRNGDAWLRVWGKGRSEADERVPLAAEVAAAIEDYLNCRTAGRANTTPLFTATGNRSGGKRIAPTTISTMLKKMMQDAGYDGERLTAHSLRHTAAQTALRASGYNVYAVQKLLRHSSPATTEIYLHEDEHTTQAEIELARGVYGLYHGQEKRA